MLIAASVISGCNDNSANQEKGNEVNQNPQEEQIQQQAPIQTPGQLNTAPSSNADKYGREPGHAHYGHDHPTSQDQPTNQNMQPNPVQQPQATTPGGKDKYGREPGHAHYGHDHPLQDDEKSTPPIQTSPIRVP